MRGVLNMTVHDGNAPRYAPEHVKPVEVSPLRGKSVCYLGSSVTLGYASNGISFADYIAARHGTVYIKEAVSGTTLADIDECSYVARLKAIDLRARFDLFVCQLSTNDAKKQCELGSVRGEGAEYDTQTVCGAMEYIMAYVRERWHCPVVFYTNCHYDHAGYAAMVEALHEMEKTYPGLGVIDLYTDREFNSIGAEERALYMADLVHPTQAGYLLWWTPKMEEYLCRML